MCTKQDHVHYYHMFLPIRKYVKQEHFNYDIYSVFKQKHQNNEILSFMSHY